MLPEALIAHLRGAMCLITGKGLKALFAGSSGTDKTMTAEVMTRELGVDLYKVDLPMVGQQIHRRNRKEPRPHLSAVLRTFSTFRAAEPQATGKCRVPYNR